MIQPINFKQQINTTTIKQNSTTPIAKKEEKSNTKTLIKAGVGLGLTALAGTGIYLVSKGRKATSNVNVDSIFQEIKNAESYITALKETKVSGKSFKELLFKLTDNEATSEKLVTEFIADPKKSKEHVRMLNQKIGGDKELIDWMLRPRGYQEAYYRHTLKVYQDPKTTPDDLLKISPNWNVWKLKDKFKDDFTIGKVPEAFGDTDRYRAMFEESLKHQDHHFEHSGVMFKEQLHGGMSGKGVRMVEAGGKKYIIKHQTADRMHNIPSIKDDISMKSDSAFLNSQLDRYLQLNGYEQGAQFRFFDYKTNSALYEMTEGTKLEKEAVHDMLKLNSDLNELNNLGVYYNDINEGNFLMKDGKLNFIDSGEASFIDFFKPGVSGYHFALPNLNGRSITESASAILLSK